MARFVDPETGETIDIDTGDRRVREQFAAQVEIDRTNRRQLLRRLAIDEIPMTTETGYLEPLLRFFRARERRKRSHG
jgi:hypothetical protein